MSSTHANSPSLGFPPVAELLPHEPPMVVLDAVVTAEASSIQCSVVLSERDPFMIEGRVRCVVCLEYMAQAIGAFVGLERRARGLRPEIGYIIGVRALTLHRSYLERGTALLVRADLTWNDVGTATFEATVHSEGQLIAQGQITVYQPSDPERVS